MGLLDRLGLAAEVPFTDRARGLLARARQEAVALRHEYIGTEHLLLALVAEGEGVSASVLADLRADPARLRDVTLATVARGTAAPPRDEQILPYTSRAKKVLELATAEARELGHVYVGTEHLLLGLVREERGIAAQVLADAGVTLGRARAEVVRLLGPQRP